MLRIGPWPAYPASSTLEAARRGSARCGSERIPGSPGREHRNRLEQVLARLEWDGQEGLLTDGSGQVVGGTMSSVFAVRGDKLVTPQIARCGVKGTMRRVVMTAAAAIGLHGEETDLAWLHAP